MHSQYEQEQLKKAQVLSGDIPQSTADWSQAAGPSALNLVTPHSQNYKNRLVGAQCTSGVPSCTSYASITSWTPQSASSWSARLARRSGSVPKPDECRWGRWCRRPRVCKNVCFFEKGVTLLDHTWRSLINPFNTEIWTLGSSLSDSLAHLPPLIHLYSKENNKRTQTK